MPMPKTDKEKEFYETLVRATKKDCPYKKGALSMLESFKEAKTTVTWEEFESKFRLFYL